MVVAIIGKFRESLRLHNRFSESCAALASFHFSSRGSLRRRSVSHSHSFVKAPVSDGLEAKAGVEAKLGSTLRSLDT